MRIRVLQNVFCLAVIAAFICSGSAVKAHVGTGIDLDRQGRIYFTDTYHNRIWRLDTNGTLTKVLEGVHLDYLIVGEDGSLYMIKDGVWKMTPQGEMTEVLNLTQFPARPGRLLCIDRQANIYSVDSNPNVAATPRFYRRTQDGKVTLIAGGGASPQQPAAMFSHINSALCAPDGSLYLRDDQGLRRIAPDGRVSTLAHGEDAGSAEGGEDSLVRTMGLAVDNAGNVYIANYWKRAVMKVTPDGQVSTLDTSTWPWVPVGVASSRGDVYVLERMGNPYGPSSLVEVSTLADRLSSPRVRKVSADGTITTLVAVKGNRSLAVVVVPAVFVGVVLFFWQVRRRRTKKSRSV